MEALVVGGGPAGLIAAEILAEKNVSVTLLEHRRSAGRKFVLAGRGGLNLTHSEPLEAFRVRYRTDRDGQIDRALQSFSPTDLRAWAAGHGEPTFVGSSGRVFPESFGARPLLRSWLAALTNLGVDVQTQHEFVGFGERPTELLVRTSTGVVESRADVIVLALGGPTWPRVGSDGSWQRALASAGVQIAPFRPSNVGVVCDWSDHFADRFSGDPIKNVAVDAGGSSTRGDVMIDSGGLEGGPVYACSAELRAQLDAGQATLTIDLLPDKSPRRVQADLAKQRPKASTSDWLRKLGLAPQAIGLARECFAAALPRQVDELTNAVKSVQVRALALQPIERAISASGGVRLDQLNNNFMLHALPGVFVAGEMLDWDAPTGGYLLQASFSSGVAAAQGALSWLHEA